MAVLKTVIRALAFLVVAYAVLFGLGRIAEAGAGGWVFGAAAAALALGWLVYSAARARSRRRGAAGGEHETPR